MRTARRGNIRVVALIVGLIFATGGAADAVCWECSHDGWDAWTSYRAMQNPTKFECGCGTCGDSCSPFHSKGNSWVDFVGGISSVCDDHSDSFYGPRSGEWHGCSEWDTNWQESSGWKRIENVSGPFWDRWPLRWLPGRYYADDISFFLQTDTMRDPFGTVYDLDFCSDIEPIGTVYWGNFPVTSQLISGSTTPEQGFAVFYLEGHAGVSCGPDQGSCYSKVCSDLHVYGNFRCYVVGDTCSEPESPGEPLPYENASGASR